MSDRGVHEYVSSNKRPNTRFWTLVRAQIFEFEHMFELEYSSSNLNVTLGIITRGNSCQSVDRLRFLRPVDKEEAHEALTELTPSGT